VRVAPTIVLSRAERRRLLGWSLSRTAPHRLVLRSQVVLLAAKGLDNRAIAGRLEVSDPFVGKWRSRFHRLRLVGIEREAPRSGRTPEIPARTVRRILEKTLQGRRRGTDRWSTRTLAEAVGVSHMTVSRLWRAHRLTPEARSPTPRSDARFLERHVDVVGSYLDPPKRAVVFAVHGETRTEVLEPTPAIPIRRSSPKVRSRAHRHEVSVDLLDALDLVDGTAIREFHHRDRGQEFLAFLRAIDEAVPPEGDIHIVLDDVTVRTEERLKRWLAHHPRFRIHVVPAGSSWHNATKRCLTDLMDGRTRRRNPGNVRELKAAIREYRAANAESPRPFIWMKSPETDFRRPRSIPRSGST